ncbi:beta-ketoacyl-[acyl-carrier-protein] synthase family protein [Pontiellaceae bacterium B1224]|nr:beta-ketoacyl-[acyl-carrier-protein] synthase family protein [Pontiellaceae bacterium B1224]
MIGKNRVVITGVGVLAANGIGKEAFWNSLLAGESGIGPITLFDTSDIPHAIAGEVTDFNPETYIEKSFKPKRMARFTQLALAATNLAIEDAHVLDSLRTITVPICMGVSTSATEVIETQVLRINDRGVRYASPLTAITSLPQAGAGTIAAVLGIKTETMTVSTGCPAGLDAIALAFDSIRRGKRDIAIAGGADAPITKLTIATFDAANMIPSAHKHPEKASKPFDQNRDGGVIAEGACVLILENLDNALSRGAQPLLEILGYGYAGDNQGQPPGHGLNDSMSEALCNAGIMPQQIDYISAHGPSDIHLDYIETLAIKTIFGEHAYKLAVSSIKGVTGNPLAAAGPMQISACAKAFATGILPPTANYETADPSCDLDYVPQARESQIDFAMINNHGFGGSNSSLVVKRYK